MIDLRMERMKQEMRAMLAKWQGDVMETYEQHADDAVTMSDVPADIASMWEDFPPAEPEELTRFSKYVEEWIEDGTVRTAHIHATADIFYVVADRGELPPVVYLKEWNGKTWRLHYLYVSPYDYRTTIAALAR